MKQTLMFETTDRKMFRLQKDAERHQAQLDEEAKIVAYEYQVNIMLPIKFNEVWETDKPWADAKADIKEHIYEFLEDTALSDLDFNYYEVDCDVEPAIKVTKFTL
jgi:hypothetical protein